MYALAVMGRDNSSNIGPFLEHTKCRLGCSAKGDNFPGTDEHVVSVQAHTDEALAQGVQMVVQTLQEVPPLGEGGSYRLRIVVPQKAASFMVGRSGENLKQLQRSTGVKVLVDSKTYCGSGPEADQMVTLKGSPWWAMWLARPNSERLVEANMAGGGCQGNM